MRWRMQVWQVAFLSLSNGDNTRIVYERFPLSCMKYISICRFVLIALYRIYPGLSMAGPPTTRVDMLSSVLSTFEWSRERSFCAVARYLGILWIQIPPVELICRSAFVTVVPSDVVMDGGGRHINEFYGHDSLDLWQHSAFGGLLLLLLLLCLRAIGSTAITPATRAGPLLTWTLSLGNPLSPFTLIL